MARTRTDFGKLIRTARKERNLSQKEVGKKAGLSNGQMISNIERNMSPPPPRLFKALNKTLGISIDTLIDMSVKNYRERIREMVN